MCNWITHNFLSLLNLVAFLVSVFILWKTMKAVERQVERTSSPVIVLRRQDWKLSENELLQPQINADVLHPFQMKNVGSGTALEVHWRFKTASGDELFHGMVPQVQSNHVLKTRISADRLGLKHGVSCTFECDYRSVNGDSYRSVTTLDNLKIVQFNARKLATT